MGNGAYSGAIITFCLQGFIFIEASFASSYFLPSISLEHLPLRLDPILRLAGRKASRKYMISNATVV
jgi:hypothetical protein